MSIADLRKDYQRSSLNENQVAADPFSQFDVWFKDARVINPNGANVMTLSTVSATGTPSSRIVLLKDYDQRGFTWFTNYDSKKGQELAENPHAALLFFWGPLEHQVRIEGRVEKISDAENDTYFHSRPLGSRQSALASAQSQVIANRDLLEQQLQQVVEQFGDAPPRPEQWGGYRLTPTFIEFWQGRSSRLHDRIAYTKQDNGQWQISRLQP
jgi:pyridoxamine 5'-phosphate oxidase